MLRCKIYIKHAKHGDHRERGGMAVLTGTSTLGIGLKDDPKKQIGQLSEMNRRKKATSENMGLIIIFTQP